MNTLKTPLYKRLLVSRGAGGDRRQSFRLAQEDHRHRKPARHPQGVFLGSVSPHAARPVRFRCCRLRLSRTGQRLAFVPTANPVKTIVDAQRESKPGKQPE